MDVKNMSEKAAAIYIYIAKNGPVSVYDVAEKIDGSYGSIYYQIEKLIKAKELYSNSVLENGITKKMISITPFPEETTSVNNEQDALFLRNKTYYHEMENIFREIFTRKNASPELKKVRSTILKLKKELNLELKKEGEQ